MPFDLSALETVVLETPPATAPDFNLPDTIDAVSSSGQQHPLSDQELISETVFLEQWNLLHDMAGGMVQMRTDAPCPLGDQARGEGGRIAGTACYELIKSQPVIARLILSTKSTFLGQVIAVGMHGFTCVQVIKASAAGQPIEAPESAADPVFKSTRGETE